MKVIILAGGLGSRISQYTQKIPKPMITIGNIPMLSHIMDIFINYGFDDFIIAGGYKIEIIKKYYKNSSKYKNVKIINTGKNTMTGGRILKLKKYLKNEKFFFMTYGDGVGNIDIKKLFNFHKKRNKIATVTAVRPPVKFGELEINKKSVVKSFIEKPQVDKGWINGGFFVLNNKIFNYIDNQSTIFEKEPLTKLSKMSELIAYKHSKYWKCMDNLNEKNQLEEIYKNNKTIWKIK